MPDDPCRGVRAHAHSLEEEVAFMRAVVAALRESTTRRRSIEPHRGRSPWKTTVVAFFVGVSVGALTLIAVARCM